MASKKRPPAKAATSAETVPAAEEGKEPISKMEAVRQALAQLGSKATPSQIREQVRNQYGMELGLNLVSAYKTSLAKRARRAAAKKKTGAKAPAAPKAKPAAANTSTPPGITLNDITTVQQLAKRIGVKRLHELIDLVVR
jgi:hypothetical protein